MKSSGKPKEKKSHLIPQATLASQILWAIGFYKRYTVKGDSMTPLLSHNSQVLGRRQKRYKPDDIVVAKSVDGLVIKRLTKNFTLVGENICSSSYKVKEEDITAKIFFEL